jgi:hypothetical protein
MSIPEYRGNGADSTKHRDGEQSEAAKSVTVVSAKQMSDLRNMHRIQGDNGNWNYDPYMHGMYNGMELMLATIEDREPVFKKAPETWLADIEVSTADNSTISSLDTPSENALKPDAPGEQGVQQ